MVGKYLVHLKILSPNTNKITITESYKGNEENCDSNTIKKKIKLC